MNIKYYYNTSYIITLDNEEQQPINKHCEQCNKDPVETIKQILLNGCEQELKTTLEKLKATP